MHYAAASLPASLRALSLVYPRGGDALTYKEISEAFVTGHLGGDSIIELSMLLLSLSLSVWIHRLLTIFIRARVRARRATDAPSLLRHLVAAPHALRDSHLSAHRRSSFTSILPRIAFDLVLVVAPGVVSFTFAADGVPTLFAAQVACIVGLICAHRLRFGYYPVRWPASGNTTTSSNTYTTGRGDADARAPSTSSVAASADAALLRRLNSNPKQFLTNYRTSLMIGTSIAILAVGQLWMEEGRTDARSERNGRGVSRVGARAYTAPPLSHARVRSYAPALVQTSLSFLAASASVNRSD
jgi:hypothetical protein